MAASDLIVAIGAMLGAIVVWSLVIFFIPWCQVSQLRYRLWQIRDEVAADIRARRLADSEAMRDLVVRIESFIRNAHRLTYAKCLPFLCIPKEAVQQLRSQRMALVGQLSPAERTIYDEYFGRFNSALTRHLLFGAPSGWVVLVLASFGELVGAVFKESNPINYARQKVKAATVQAYERMERLFDAKRSEAHPPLSAFAGG